MKSKRKTKAKRITRRMSRPVLEKMLADLKHRTDQQVWTVEAIMKVVAPTGQTLMAAFWVQKVAELALDAHLREMREIHGITRVMCGPAA
jgi:hypothetical protein